MYLVDPAEFSIELAVMKEQRCSDTNNRMSSFQTRRQASTLVTALRASLPCEAVLLFESMTMHRLFDDGHAALLSRVSE